MTWKVPNGPCPRQQWNLDCHLSAGVLTEADCLCHCPSDIIAEFSGCIPPPPSWDQRTLSLKWEALILFTSEGTAATHLKLRYWEKKKKKKSVLWEWEWGRGVTCIKNYVRSLGRQWSNDPNRFLSQKCVCLFSACLLQKRDSGDFKPEWVIG